MSSPTQSPPPRPGPFIPRQRTDEAGSLTQRNARSGQQCEHCGDIRLTEIGMTLTDGTTVRFVSCHNCERKSWRRAETGTVDLSLDVPLDVPFDEVIAHTRKSR